MDYNEAHGLLDSVYLPPIKRKEIVQQCDIRKLSVLSYANGFTLWHYKAAECPDFHDNWNFFGNISDMLQPGDIIFATGKWGAIQVVVLSIIAGPSSTGVAINMLKSSI